MKTGVGLFLLLLLLYNANLTVLLGNDTRPSRLTAVSLVKRGDIDISEFDAFIRNRPTDDYPYWVVATPRGLISRVGWGAPAFAAPLFAGVLAARGGRIDEVTALYVAKLASSLAVAGAAVLLFAIALRLGASRRAALAAALLYGLATCAFSVVSQALWQHGPAELFLTLGIYLLARGGRVALPASGAAFAAVVVCRPPDWPFAVAALAYVAWAQRRALLAWLAAAAPLAALQAATNWYYLGAPWRFPQSVMVTGRDALPHASYWSLADLPAHLAGLLISPSRGLLVYSPFLLFLFLVRWREIAPPLRFMLGGAAALALFTASYYGWYGGWCFGYRMLVDATPVLCLVLVPVLGRLGRLRPIFLIAAGMSLVFHMVGAYCYIPWAWDAAPDVDFHEERLWSVEGSQLAYWLTHAHPRQPPQGL
jgi:hypothetical protein